MKTAVGSLDVLPTILPLLDYRFTSVKASGRGNRRAVNTHMLDDLTNVTAIGP